MNHPADFINVVIEELVRQRFELPHLARPTSSPGMSERWLIADRSTPYTCSV
jgi:hypothetical protein